MKLKVSRFRIRKPDPVAVQPRAAQSVAHRPVTVVKQVQQLIADEAFLPSEMDDGFGNQSFLRPVAASAFDSP